MKLVKAPSIKEPKDRISKKEIMLEQALDLAAMLNKKKEETIYLLDHES
jgi:hypothetical protein